MTPPTLPPRDYATRARLAKWAYSTRAMDMTGELRNGLTPRYYIVKNSKYFSHKVKYSISKAQTVIMRHFTYVP